jgi:hypothetical protein
MKARVNRRGQRSDRERLRKAGHAFEQHVAIGEKAYEQSINQRLLAYDDMAHRFAETRHPSRSLPYAFVQSFKSRRHGEYAITTAETLQIARK